MIRGTRFQACRRADRLGILCHDAGLRWMIRLAWGHGSNVSLARTPDVSSEMSRRELLGGISGSALLGLAAGPAGAQEASREAFTFCLNTSTIRGQNLSIVEEVALAARAGYQAIEPWMNELERYVREGGSLRDLGRRIQDAGLQVVDAIGFPEWIVDDEAKRRKGLDDARKAMDMLQQLGCRRIAAPPAGATNQADLSLPRAAERYRALLELGEQFGVVPQLELWGFSRCLNRLGEVAQVAIEAGHPQACVLADVYHLHKGGSGFAGVRLLSAGALQVFHM